MWNIFEHPWTGIVAALVVQIFLTIVHMAKPSTRKLWHTVIPAVIIALAFGTDYFVKTDREQVNALINETLEATAAEDLGRIENIFADDYDDGYHRSKEAIMGFCRKWFSTPIIIKNSLPSKQLDIQGNKAAAILVVVTQVDPRHEIAGNFSIIQTTSKIKFGKYGKKWLVNGAEILMINNQNVRWGEF